MLRRDPSRPEIYFILGGYYERQERYKDALRTYERLEQRDPNLPAPIFAAMARMHLELQNVDEAKRYAQKGLEADANSWRLHYILGNVYAAMNQPQKQRDHYADAIKYIDRAIPYSQDPRDLQFAKQKIQSELEQIKK